MTDTKKEPLWVDQKNNPYWTKYNVRLLRVYGTMMIVFSGLLIVVVVRWIMTVLTF